MGTGSQSGERSGTTYTMKSEHQPGPWVPPRVCTPGGSLARPIMPPAHLCALEHYCARGLEEVWKLTLEEWMKRIRRHPPYRTPLLSETTDQMSTQQHDNTCTQATRAVHNRRLRGNRTKTREIHYTNFKYCTQNNNTHFTRTHKRKKKKAAN